MSCTGRPANSAIFTLVRSRSRHLDDPQRQSLFHSLKKGATRWTPTPEKPTVEEWKDWLTSVSEEAAVDPELSAFARQRIIDRLDKARLEEPPTGPEFVALQKFEKQTMKARFAMEEQAGQIGAWYGVPAEEVTAVVAKYRKEYFETPAKDRPEVPENYVKAFRITSPNVPKDPATIYGYWMAERAENYENKSTFGRYVALDLETTGISAISCDIIEFGCVVYDDQGNEIERYETFIQPRLNEEGVYDTGPVEVHGITASDVADAPKFKEVAPRIIEILDNACIIGHNVSFDTKHLRVALTRFIEDHPDVAPDQVGKRTPWTAAADTYWKAARSIQGLTNSKLVTVAEHLEVPYTDGHRALHDAVVSGEVFFKIRNAELNNN